MSKRVSKHTKDACTQSLEAVKKIVSAAEDLHEAIGRCHVKDVKELKAALDCMSPFKYGCAMIDMDVDLWLESVTVNLTKLSKGDFYVLQERGEK